MKVCLEKRASEYRQRGVATLAISMIILVVATLAAFAVARSGLFEQRLSGTDIRSKEVNAAAMSGLQYAIWWLESNSPCDEIPLEDKNLAFNVDEYELEISFELKNINGYCDDPPSAQSVQEYTTKSSLIDITSTATATQDSHVSKTMRVTVVRSNILSGNIQNMPPMLIEDCVKTVNGNPTIYPSEGSGSAIGTSMGSANPDCLEDLGKLEVYEGHKVVLDPQSTVWDAVFGPGMDKATLRALSQMDNSSIHYVDTHLSANQVKTIGDKSSMDSPIILFFDEASGCPNIQGGTVVYGIVFYENENCAKNGWGNGDVHGSVVMAGELDGFNANPNIYGLPDLDKIFQELLESVSIISPLPGSWRDF